MIQQVKQFMMGVGCTTEEFNVRQVALYTGLQLEEMAEKLEALLVGVEYYEPTTLLYVAMIHLKEVSARFKAGQYDNLVGKANREDILDADIDLAWVSLGSAWSQGADVPGAVGEVGRANMDKLVGCPDCCGDGVQLTTVDGRYTEKDCSGCAGLGRVALKDGSGKVVKPLGWCGPELGRFVR